MQASDEERFNCKSSILSKQNHIVEQIGENGSIQYNCTACRKVFRSRSQRYYHINCNQLQNLIFNCEYCEKSFARRAQWKYHTESHLSPVNKCDMCQKTFSNPLALKKHLTLHKAEPKVCPHCDKTFKKKISLDQHVSSQHFNHLQYGCAHCSKKYASKSTLQMHLQTHEKKRFECTFCGKLFQRNSILNLHIKRHNTKNSYICTICGKTFSESGALARHSKLHQDSVLEYYCKICDKSMLRKDNMARHLTTIHPEKMFDEVVKIIKPLPRQQSIKTRVCDNLNANKSLITEDKLLREPFDIKEASNNLPQHFTKILSTEECPITNKINVITAVPTCKNEIFAKYSDNYSQELANECITTKQFQQTCPISESQRVSNKTPKEMELKSEVYKPECKLIEEDVINRDNLSFVNNNYENNISQLKEQQLSHSQNYFHVQNNTQKLIETTFSTGQKSVGEELPTVPTNFSSVIKSVGNVKKDLTSNDLLTINSKNQISVEYKHKKYCRNNYNIDLYRRILGFDEDDEDENIQKQKKCDHVPKLSTPVHWRKCFKNNYEISGS